MYICQDKCYRSVPEKDHRYAQFDDYIEGGVFCGICCVVIGGGSEAQKQMQQIHKETGMWICPCCSARPRAYFDLDKKRGDFFLKNLQNSKYFKQIVDEFFRVRKQSRDDVQRFKELENRLQEVAAPPQRAKPHQKNSKITSFIIPTENKVQRAREISLFPHH